VRCARRAAAGLCSRAPDPAARGPQITKLAAKLKLLKQDDPVRTKTTNLLVDKLFSMGLIPTKKSLLQCEALPVSAFCRRRLPVVLVRLKFCETLKEAVTFVEQGHIRVGAAAPLLHPAPPPLHSLCLCTLPPRPPSRPCACASGVDRRAAMMTLFCGLNRRGRPKF